jgi:hypothetical protein
MSATYTFPEPSIATPFGNLNCAKVPAPSVKPTVVPARVVTDAVNIYSKLGL